MSRIFKPTDDLSCCNKPSIFLAGYIENGKAIDWQYTVEHKLADYDIDIINPRRNNWDASWEQSINNEQFREQVEWELQGLSLASIVLMYFSPGTQSPITLLELGLMSQSRKLIVACPEGFWRKGNIDITCQHYSIPLYSELEKALDHVINQIDI